MPAQGKGDTAKRQTRRHGDKTLSRQFSPLPSKGGRGDFYSILDAVFTSLLRSPLHLLTIHCSLLTVHCSLSLPPVRGLPAS